MAPMTPEDDLKLLYVYIKLSTGKPKIADVAKNMGLKEATAAARISTLMKRLEKDHGGIYEEATTLDKRSSPVPKQSAKRKRSKKDAAEEEVKKTNDDDAKDGYADGVHLEAN